MKRILLLLLVVAGMVQATTVYRVVHPDGRVEYSDEPRPDSTELKLPDAPPAPPPANSPAFTPPSPNAAPKESVPVAYRSIRILQPADDQTVFFDAAGMPVQVTIDPALQKGDVVVIELDGHVVARGSQTGFNLPEVYRGTHALSASVVDSAGKTRLRSTTVHFHMSQHTTLKAR